LGGTRIRGRAVRTAADGALFLAGVGELPDAGELLSGVDRTDIGVLVQRVTDPQRLEPALQRGDEFLGDRLLHQQPRPGAADVTLVEEDPVYDAFDSLVDRGVVEDDVGGLAAEFEGELLARAGGGSGNQAADLGRTGEGDLVDVRVFDQRATGIPGAGDDVHHSRG
jgi:hypothetical protein